MFYGFNPWMNVWWSGFSPWGMYSPYWMGNPFTYGMPPFAGMYPDAAQEIEFLKSQAEILKQQLNWIDERIRQLERES